LVAARFVVQDDQADELLRSIRNHEQRRPLGRKAYGDLRAIEERDLLQSISAGRKAVPERSGEHPPTGRTPAARRRPGTGEPTHSQVHSLEIEWSNRREGIPGNQDLQTDCGFRSGD
jgi:hypothetical protein